MATIKKCQVSFLILLTLIVKGLGQDSGQFVSHESEEDIAKEFLQEIDQQVGNECHNRAIKEWLYATNITEENRKAAAESAVRYGIFWKKTWNRVNSFHWKEFKDPDVQRQFKLLSTLGMSVLPDIKLRKYNVLKQSMESIYSTAKLCEYPNRENCSWTLEPELTELLRSSREPHLLKYIWLEWRYQTGRKMRQNYTDMVHLINEAAQLNGFKDAADFDTRAYDSETFEEQIETLWQQLKSFYMELHAYVRFKLREYYGPKTISAKGPIPAHLLGNMWAQAWTNIFDLVVPFPNVSSVDVTDRMIEKGMKPLDMVKLAENFFKSIGLPELPPEFWSGSILVKPKDRNNLICHASAWDLCNQKDFWIKQCTRVNMEDLITLHHEIENIHYQIQYKNLPKVYRDGANPGFHEAIGDLIALSVQTPKHLRAIDLLPPEDEKSSDYEIDINYLMSMALEKIAFLPFGYLMDLWRWGIYRGSISEDDYNCAWWELREKYQGLTPPDTRSESDFDAGSKFHIASNVAYIRYFVSNIIQFQFHEALCKEAGQFSRESSSTQPLHRCDIFNSTKAGEKLAQMLKLGSSKPWPYAMELVTGKKVMDAQPILDYFEPLMKWLQETNKKNKEYIGWKREKVPCKKKMSESESQSKNANKRISSNSFIVYFMISIILINF